MMRKNKIIWIYALFIYFLHISLSITAQVSNTKSTIDFKKIQVKNLGKSVALFDTTGERPVQICPLATIDEIEEINTDYDYVIVYCLNRYFIINKYGEMSFGYFIDGSYYDPINNTLLCSKFKKRAKRILYDFQGRAIGSSEKYFIESHYQSKNDGTTYYVVLNKQKQKGIMNHEGKLLIECGYNDIIFKPQGQVEIKSKNKENEIINLIDLK